MNELLNGKASELLKAKDQPIVVITHTNPDGDAIGSCLGLYGTLTIAGHQNVSVVIPNGDPDFLHWMRGHDKIINATGSPVKAKKLIADASVIFCLDFNHFNRADGLEEDLRSAKATKVLIDHHPQPAADYDLYLVNVEASSTAELVYEFVAGLQLEKYIDHDIAACFYAGIVTDTGSFSYGCNNPRTYEIMAELMRFGIDGEKIHRQIYSTYSENRLRLLGFCLSEKLVVMPEYQAAYISLTRQEMNRFRHQVGDTEGVVNYALSMKGISLAALFTESKDFIRISFRSSGEVDVNELARIHFNGGGHVNAAGGRGYTGMNETIGNFVEIVKKLNGGHE